MPNCPNSDSAHPEGVADRGNCVEQPSSADAVQAAQAPLGAGSKTTLARPTVVTIASRYRALIVAGVLLVAAYWDLFSYFWIEWNKDHGYYSHGPLVPLITLFMVWANRKRMALVKMRASWLGLVLILPCLPIFAFGRWTGSSALMSLTLLPVAIGVLLMLTGPRMTRLLLFPMLFLFFMIPMPSTLLDGATFSVQMQSTSLAAKILGLTYDVSQTGATIESGDLPEPLVVGVPCSGFRLLISLLTFTAFFVYMVQTKPWKKALMVLLAFPLSLFINSLRITMIGYAGIWTGSAEAMHKFHDWSGYLNLVICFAILFGFARLLKADRFGIPDPGPPSTDAMPQEIASGQPYGGATRMVAVAVMALVVVSNMLIVPLRVSMKGQLDRAAIPSSFGNWTSHEVQVDKVVLEMLKTGDMMQRVYTNSITGRQVVVFTEAARDSDAFHDPHSCLPGGGSPITQDVMIDLRIKKPKPMTIHATMLQATSSFGSSLVVYWYMRGAKTYPTTPAMRKGMRLVQLQAFREIAMNPGRSESVKKRVHENQWLWYRFSTEVWQDTDADLEELRQFIAEFVANTRGFGE
jgi:exosortase